MFQRSILPPSLESKRSHARNNLAQPALASDGFLLGLLSDPEDGGSIFL
jgi:hypothetical protein